jgi:hypothetical protein
MLRRFFALLALLCALGALAGAGMAFAADPAPTPLPPTSSDGLVMRARAAFNGSYRPGSWLPLAVELENQGPDRQVELQAALRSGAQYVATIDLPNNARKIVTLYTYLPVSSRQITLRLLDAGVEVQTQQLQLQPTAGRARTVAVVAGGGAAPRPPARLTDGSSLSTSLLTLADLPDHALGLSSFDLIVLSDLPTAELSSFQLDALRAWVFRGGQLVVDGGPGAARTLLGLPAELQPATIDSLSTLSAAALFGGDLAADEPLPVSLLDPTSDSAGRSAYRVPIAGLPREAQLLEQRYGRGAVGAFPLPLGHAILLNNAAITQIWADLLEQTSATPAGAGAPDLALDTFVEGNLAGALTGLPALAYPPVTLLALLIGVYILAVGPGTYLVLRRLDRQALGWIVVPAITLLFAGGAYALGYAQRGGDVVLNQLTLIETYADGGALARSRSFAGLFSPVRQAYDLEAFSAGAEPLLLRPISLQGPWDASLGGANAIFLQPETGGGGVRAFDVAQWSMRALTADTVSAGSPLQAQLTLYEDELSGSVTNTGDQTIEDVVLVQGDHVARLGDLAPGAQRDLAAAFGADDPRNPKRAADMSLSYLIYGDLIEQSQRPGGTPLPAVVQVRIRMLDALFAYGPNPRSGHPLLIGWTAEPNLELTPVGLRAERQHLALLVHEPQITADAAPITLGRGWLHKRVANGQSALCYGALGAGVSLGADPVLLQLSLPRDLYGFRPSELSVLSETDGPWVAENQVELYNWVDDAWEALPISGRNEPLMLEAPERFVGSHGRLWARIASTAAQPAFGCIYLDVTMKGTLP